MATEKRLIDANALIEELPIVTEDKKISLYGAVADFMVMISAMPTVDAVEVVHGWTEVIEPFEVTLTTRCGLCGVAMGNLDNFCPNCGAKMDGDGNERC